MIILVTIKALIFCCHLKSENIFDVFGIQKLPRESMVMKKIFRWQIVNNRDRWFVYKNHYISLCKNSIKIRLIFKNLVVTADLLEKLDIYCYNQDWDRWVIYIIVSSYERYRFLILYFKIFQINVEEEPAVKIVILLL